MIGSSIERVFTSDAVIDYVDSGGGRADLETTVKWLAEVLGVFAGLQHNMTNHVVEIDGDRARACTYYVAYHSVVDGKGGETVLVMGGFYRDRLVRTAPRLAHLRARRARRVDGRPLSRRRAEAAVVRHGRPPPVVAACVICADPTAA